MEAKNFISWLMMFGVILGTAYFTYLLVRGVKKHIDKH